MPPSDIAKPAKPAQDPNSSEFILQECEALEAALAALRSSYDQYFLGIDRQAPTRAHDELKKRMLKLKGSFIRSTSAKFRVQSLHSKYLTYERLWTRTLQEIEAGTYKRDLFKARRRAETRKEPSATASGESRKDVVELPEEVSDLDFEEVEQLAGRVSPNEPKLAPVATPAVPAVGGVPFKGVPSVPSVAPAVPAVAPATGATPFRGVPSVAPAVPAVAGTPPRGLPSVSPAVPPVGGAARPAATPPGMAAKGPGAAAPARPAAATTPAPRPPSAGGTGGLSDDKLRAVYDAYVTAKRRCQEDTSKLSFDSVAATLRKQVPELLKQHDAKAVEFKVVIKDGKASLKAVPK